jgi:hypothetical protein
MIGDRMNTVTWGLRVVLLALVVILLFMWAANAQAPAPAKVGDVECVETVEGVLTFLAENLPFPVKPLVLPDEEFEAFREVVSEKIGDHPNGEYVRNAYAMVAIQIHSGMVRNIFLVEFEDGNCQRVIDVTPPVFMQTLREMQIRMKRGDKEVPPIPRERPKKSFMEKWREHPLYNKPASLVGKPVFEI